MTPSQMHFGRKSPAPITNLIGQQWLIYPIGKKTKTNYVLAQPAELQVFTTHDSDGEVADYLVFNESKKRGRSVSENFEEYQILRKKPSQTQ